MIEESIASCNMSLTIDLKLFTSFAVGIITLLLLSGMVNAWSGGFNREIVEME
jgi:hypothetical protein